MGLARLFLAFSLVALLAGQQNRKTARLLVNLNVTAVDGSGQPVSDLRMEDLQLLDNGKARDVVWLHALPPKGPLTVRSGAGLAAGAGPYSNRGLNAGATFILLDLFNSDLATRGNGANEIMRALEKLESSDNVYLYLLDSKARLLGVHTVAVAKGQPADDVPWTRRIKPLLDRALLESSGLKMVDSRYASLRIAPTWQALSAMAALIAQVPGPKSFVWVSEGIENGVLEPGGFLKIDTTPLRSFAANLAALETSIYSTQQQPNGLLAPANEGSPGDTLEQLSELTGGKRFPTGAAQAVIAQAMNASRQMNYTLAFAPDRLDGKYHKLRVASTRADVRISTAQSYYAAAVPDLDRRDASIVDAMAGSPFDYPEIGLTATLAKVEGGGGKIQLAIRVNAADVLFIREAGRSKARLDVELVKYGSDGRGAIAGGMPVDLDMSGEEYSSAAKNGIEIVRQAQVEEGVGQVRLVVMDRNSNLAGTLTMPLDPLR